MGLLPRRRRGAFFSRYFDHGIFDVSPFESLDQLGVGGMVEMGTAKGRETKPDLKVGVCGEHGGDPRSIHFFDDVGLDYVSCSPFRVPVARLEAGPLGAGQAAQPLEERRGEVLSAAQHARVVVADGPEQRQQVLAGGVAVVARRTPDQLDQPAERVVDVAAEQVEVGHQGLGGDVVGGRRRRPRGPAARSTPRVRCSTLAIASPAAASASAGLASTSFWYSATAVSMSSASSAAWAAA